MTSPGAHLLPMNPAEDIDAFETEVRRFQAGGMAPSMFKAKRVPRGIYEQRKDGTYMVRVRVTGGRLNAPQARALAALSRESGDGKLHVTTRQNVQFHDVALPDSPAILRRLTAAGLTTRGGGGNTVRNVTACPYAGICPNECLDVTPCAQAVTDYLIALVGSYNLPRKYKIAFSGCGADCALAQVSDLGFIAEVRDGQPGFRVLAGGGLGSHSRVADVLLDWTPATEIIRVAEAVRRLFDQMGDRIHKHKARLRFVLERMGAPAFRQRFAEQVGEVAREGVPAWTERVPLHPAVPAGGVARPPQEEWQAGVRVIAQRQAGYVAVIVHLPLGFLPAEDLARIVDLAEKYSADAGLRTTRTQNLLLRFVKVGDLPALAEGLRGLRTDVVSPVPLDRFVTCAGASTCRLGICLARNAAQACAAALAEGGIARDTLEAMEFHLNGCSNACGQQPVGSIGFFGLAQRVPERRTLVPSYGVTLGGRCGIAGARLGVAVGRIPARALPAFVRELAADFQAQRRTGERFLDYFDRRGRGHFEALAAPYAALPDLEAHPDFHQDVGAEEEFSLAGRGAGECGAGVFEVILQDLEAAKKATAPEEILLHTARALLITRGVDAQDSETVRQEFARHFIDTGLVAEEFRPLVSGGNGDLPALVRLRERVELLYSTLDANLEFHPPDRRVPAAAAAGQAAATTPAAAGPGVAVELNLKGVPCPMNFVKAKLRLETMNVGDTLALVLDDGEPIRNVPASFKSEGQEVGGIVDLGGGHWRVVVKKKA